MINNTMANDITTNDTMANDITTSDITTSDTTPNNITNNDNPNSDSILALGIVITLGISCLVIIPKAIDKYSSIDVKIGNLLNVSLKK